LDGKVKGRPSVAVLLVQRVTIGNQLLQHGHVPVVYYQRQ
jgi:hypothetical protein